MKMRPLGKLAMEIAGLGFVVYSPFAMSEVATGDRFLMVFARVSASPCRAVRDDWHSGRNDSHPARECPPAGVCSLLVED